MPPAGSPGSRDGSNGWPDGAVYPSRTIAYQAAGMITSIIEALQAHDQLRYTPAFMSVSAAPIRFPLLTVVHPSVYSLFSALIMHVYQMRSSNHSVVMATQQRLSTCMTALRDVSKVWLVAKMVHTLFESILGNKRLEERLQKAAAGRRPVRGGKTPTTTNNNGHGSRTKDTSPAENAEPPKRKFDDMELGYPHGPPAPQMSYERSRPQSPVPAGQTQPSLAPPPSAAPQPHMPTMTHTSPMMTHNTDAFLTTSRLNTRSNTPFNIAMPNTPPDLFLHTRNSPKISEDLWQNYQPEQLFPPEANSLFPFLSPGQSMVDPALRGPPSAPPFSTSMAPESSSMSGNAAPPINLSDAPMQNMYQDPRSWAQFQQQNDANCNDAATGGSLGRPPGVDSDGWSNTSGTSAMVPTTLNVGDWFEFFGIPNGDFSALNGGA